MPLPTLRAAALPLALVLLALTACGEGGKAKTVTVTETVASSPPARDDDDARLPARAIDGLGDAVLRIEVERCDGEVEGTGFLTGYRRVVTADHVVAGALEIRLSQGDVVVGTARVIGRSPGRGLAVLNASRGVEGPALSFANEPPRAGDRIVALGYPVGEPLAQTRGTFAASDHTGRIDGRRVRDLVQIIARSRPGSSGGPVLSERTGAVVGVLQGRSKRNDVSVATDAQAAERLEARWAERPQDVPPTECGPLGPKEALAAWDRLAAAHDAYDRTIERADAIAASPAAPAPRDLRRWVDLQRDGAGRAADDLEALVLPQDLARVRDRLAEAYMRFFRVVQADGDTYLYGMGRNAQNAGRRISRARVRLERFRGATMLRASEDLFG